MKIQVWLDIMCPFCYLGEQNLKNAIADYKGNDDINIEFKAFQLNPTQEKKANPDNPIVYTVKKGLDETRVRSSFQHIVNEAKQLDLPIDIENAKVVNSLDVLRLVKFAQHLGKENEIVDALFRAYFAEGIDLSDRKNIFTIAKKVGLDEDNVSAFLESDQYIKEVNEDRNQGIVKGLQGVPFFVIDDKYTLSGNQTKENFIRTFNQIGDINEAESCRIDSNNC